MVFGLTSNDPLPCDSKATELTYFNYLKAHLPFPFPAQFFDRIKDRKRDVTVTGMCDDFPIDDGFGVMCEVLDGGEEGQMPLSELEVERSSPDFQIVDDYITWFINAPKADDDLDGDWDEDDEDWEEEEDDLDDDDENEIEEEAPPPPARQRTGRNDPCPCGSGKKFKKCCLNSSRQSGFFD